MKYLVTRIERVLKSGVSAKNNPYSLDFTNITFSVSTNETDVFGSKETTFQYGKAANFSTLEALRGRLPIEMEITMGVEMDSYGNAKTVITDIKAIPSAQPQPQPLPNK
uniref:hypothetical protein n=1 Tax=Psychrobacter sp. TaxID=56811 RepID=UPI00159A0362|nr:hypothetical protein [Psychrobacter sp.]QJS05420.1 hypothetical protein [Psychrobacter sp.]